MSSLFVFFVLFFNTPHDLHQLRDLFPLISKNEQSNQSMVKIVNNNTQIASEIKKAYMASALMASAKFKINPLSKLQAFNEGKKMLEESIQSNQLNPETRFIRFTIQSNSPSFLMYKNNLQEDKTVILSALPHLKLHDHDLYTRINAYLNSN